MATSNYRQIAGPDGHLANRRDFTGNSMTGEWTTMCPAQAHLSARQYLVLHEDWREAVSLGKRMYVVRSYRTPIAWAIEGRPAYIADQKFSVTTSKHQTYVKAWINHAHDAFALYKAERERLGI